MNRTKVRVPVRCAEHRRPLDPCIATKVRGLAQTMSLRAVARELDLQPSSVHSILHRSAELKRDQLNLLIPSVVEDLSRRTWVRRKVSVRAVADALRIRCHRSTVGRHLRRIGVNRKGRRHIVKNIEPSQEQKRRMEKARGYQGW